MKFQLESDLVQVLLKALPGPLAEVLGSEHFAVATELPIETKVLDISLACFSQDVSDRLESLRGLLSLKLRELNSLAQLVAQKRQSWTEKALSKTDCSRGEAFRSLLERCERRGVIERKSRGAVCFTQWTQEIPPKLVSIEAKLHRWEEALQQAVYHTMHSEYSYVALDRYHFETKAPEIREAFVKAKVGLITVSVSGEVKLEVPCRKLKPQSTRSAYQKLRALRDVAGSRSSKYVLRKTEHQTTV